MPDPTEAVLLLVFVVGILGFGIVAVSATYEDAEEHVIVTNESFVQDVGNWTPVDAADEAGLIRFNDTVTVYNSSGSELTEGTDYEWAPANGSVLISDTASTTDGASASVTYEYDRRPEQSTAMLAPLRTLFEIGGVLPLAVGGGALLVGAQWLRSATATASGGGRR